MSNKVMFQVHEYDSDGWMITSGIFLHFGDTRIKVAENLGEFKVFVETINNMVIEIKETHPGLI